MNAEILFPSGDPPPPPSAPLNEANFDWAMDQADLYLGREGYQTPFWGDLYCWAMYARLAGERDYNAEKAIYHFMVVDYIMRW